MQVTLVKKINNAIDVRSFVFKPQKTFKWKAGQYIFYEIKHSNPDERGIVRHFSISSAPYEKNLMLTTRFSQGRVSTFKQALDNLAIGDKVRAFSLGGEFTLENPKERYVFIAGGIGITPYRSILMDLAHKNSLKEITLLYANRDKEIIFRDELDKLMQENSGLKISYVIEPERIGAELIKKEVPDFSERNFYISGTKSMVDALGKIIQNMGIKNNAVKLDFFPGYSGKY